MATEAERHAGLAGTVLARGIVLLVAPLLQLTPFSMVGMALATLKPAFLALLFLQSVGGARRMFAVAFLATAAGAVLDALTPSYDASALWLWASSGLSIAAELATLFGLARLVSPRRWGVGLITLGTFFSLVSLEGHVDPTWSRQLAALLWCVGHVMLFPALRRRSQPAPQPFPDEARRGLLRWGGIELARFLALGAGLLTSAVMRVSDRELAQLGVGAILACAIAGGIGYRWLVRFCDGASALGVRASLARALPMMQVVVSLFILPDVAESLFADREAAMARAGMSAVMACVLIALGVGAVAGAARRTARALGKRGLAVSLGITGRAILIIPLVLLALALVESSVDWELRRTLHNVEALLIFAFGLSWLVSAVLVLVAGLRVRQPLV